VNKTIGIVLCIIGVIGLIWGGVTYTTQQKVVDLGPIHATREKTHDIPVPPIAGGVLLLAGVALLVTSKE
jgi:UDP-N-acetylmuramyl pentapeptide phosphotransferase/UDP-N-acetylglucosamine-1-phosphate transferase